MKRYSKVPVGAHYGTRDWLLQRLTAVVMAAYTLFVIGCIVAGHPATYADFRALFGGGFVRVFTLLFFVALLYHAWIGMRDIFMDYVKPMGLRLTLQFAVVVVLLLYLVWAASILWGR